MSGLLTHRQQQILDFFAAYTEKNDRPPTLREIGRHFDIRSPNGVRGHLQALCFKGHLEKIASFSARCHRLKTRRLPEVCSLAEGQVEIRVPGRLRFRLERAEALKLQEDLAAALRE
jgi:repressor LexA